jgi:hypothetical protein
MYTALIVIALLFFAAGGLAWVLLTFVYSEYKKYAVMAAAILTDIGGAILIINAVIHPDSIQIPEVEVIIPEINVPAR